MAKYRVVNYINQFYAGIGGEEQADTGLFCDANGDETVDVTDAQLVLNYYVKSMAGKNPSWYEMTKNPKAPDAP